MKSPSCLLVYLVTFLYLSDSVSEATALFGGIGDDDLFKGSEMNFGILDGLDPANDDRFRFRMRTKRSLLRETLSQPLNEISRMQEPHQLQSLIQFLKTLSHQRMLLRNPSQFEKKSALEEGNEDFPVILKSRPQRENRRYLLWRKITG